MTETYLSLTGNDIVMILKDMSRRREASEKISQVYFRLVSALNGDLDPESQAAAEKILSGVKAKDGNLSDRIRDWVMGLQPGATFTVTQCDRDLQILTPPDRNNRSVILHRLCQKSSLTDALLESDKTRAQTYKRLQKLETIIDPNNISMDTVNVALPLALSRKTTLFHSAVVTVAGITGHGKTMFALNFIRDNMGSVPKDTIFYLNSEMSPQEIKFKKLAFKVVPYDAWNFTQVDVRGAMAQSIRTDKINVIDYLQAPSDKMWQIRDIIDDIKSRLGVGMALILLQRKNDKVWGEGAEFSAHASSLYISLSFGTIEVVKNRFREADEFRGLEKRNFDIVNGVIQAKGGWYSEGSKKQEVKKATLREVCDDPDFPREN
jgi:hypothetical protein